MRSPFSFGRRSFLCLFVFFLFHFDFANVFFFKPRKKNDTQLFGLTNFFFSGVAPVAIIVLDFYAVNEARTTTTTTTTTTATATATTSTTENERRRCDRFPSAPETRSPLVFHVRNFELFCFVVFFCLFVRLFVFFFVAFCAFFFGAVFPRICCLSLPLSLRLWEDCPRRISWSEAVILF